VMGEKDPQATMTSGDFDSSIQCRNEPEKMVHVSMGQVAYLSLTCRSQNRQNIPFMNSARWCLGKVYSVSFIFGGAGSGVAMDGMNSEAEKEKESGAAIGWKKQMK
jgi:hypothetical protein